MLTPHRCRSRSSRRSRASACCSTPSRRARSTEPSALRDRQRGSIELALAVTPARDRARRCRRSCCSARTDPTELADALAQVAQLPARFVLGVLAGTRMLGLFLDDWRTMALARRARGRRRSRRACADSSRWRSCCSCFAVRRGTKLATAMEARGFGAASRAPGRAPSRLAPARTPSPSSRCGGRDRRGTRLAAVAGRNVPVRLVLTARRPVAWEACDGSASETESRVG